jgi:hypothetical protein
MKVAVGVLCGAFISGAVFQSVIAESDSLISILEKRRTFLNTQLIIQEDKLRRDKKLLETIFRQPMDTYHIGEITVTVSAYTASIDETNDNPHQTADMTPSRIGLVAVSQDLYYELGLKKGDTIILPAFGAFRIHDTMSTHKRKNTANPIPIRRSIDILHATKKAAKLFGVKHDQKLYFIM